jgi:hypothetical protein
MTSRPRNPPGLALAAFLGLLLATSAALGQEVATGHLPDPQLTPGAWDTQAITDDVCTPGYAHAHRPSFAESNALKHQVFARYGIAWSEHGKYELDHLIPLELGGSSTLENLWPELWPEAIIKDALENRLHALVCAGELSLHDAQMQISIDWETCYRRYIGNL